MKPDIELILNTSGKSWVARGAGFEVEAESLDELDRGVRELLIASGRFPRGVKVTVLMACDRRVIPAWMRPYQSHYFNRAISFVL